MTTPASFANADRHLVEPDIIPLSVGYNLIAVCFFCKLCSVNPKHLVPPVFNKPMTSLSMLQAAIRSAAAEAIAPGSHNSSLGQFSQFLQQQHTETQLDKHITALLLAIKLQFMCEEAVKSGKVASVLAAPPAGVQQQQWAMLLSRQLGGLFITNLKLVQAAAAACPIVRPELRVDVLMTALSVGTQIGKLTSARQHSTAAAASANKTASSSSSSSSLTISSMGSTGSKEWITVLSRGL